MTNYSLSMKIMLKFLRQLLATVTALVVLFYGTAIALSFGNSDQVAISKALVCTADRGADSIFQILRNGNLLTVLAEKTSAPAMGKALPETIVSEFTKCLPDQT
jgi:hypothetical protein